MNSPQVSSASPDPIVIKPRQVLLGGTRETTSNLRMGYVWLAIVVLVVATGLVGLIVLLPPKPISVTLEPTQPTTPAPVRTTATQSPTPMQIEREKRAREEAGTLVKRFTELELELEDAWQVQAWGADALQQARQTVLDAEHTYADSEFDEAIEGYKRGVSAIEELLAQAQASYHAALERAFSALDSRDASQASDALEEASIYQPESAAVAMGRKRLARLDELIELLAGAESAESNGRFADAIQLAEKARSIDPATEGVDQVLRRLRQASLDRRFRETLAEGYEALDDLDFQAAESHFDRALGMKPGDPAAQQGLDQARTESANRRIQSGLADAQVHVESENWEAAILAFDGVRQIDASLREASEGLADARARKQLDDALKAMVAAPGRLADETRLSEAKSLIARAESVNPRGARLDEQQRMLSEQIRYASQPAPVTLVSDGYTDVRLQYNGDLGRFSSKQLRLRPGSYLVQGGRDGYRDIRFVLNVVPGPQQIEVICVERIH